MCRILRELDIYSIERIYQVYKRPGVKGNNALRLTAAYFGVSLHKVQQALRLCRLEDEWVYFIQKGVVSLAVGLEVSRLNSRVRGVLLKYVREGKRITKASIKNICLMQCQESYYL